MGRPPTITREQLLETARRVFAEKGFEATTLAEIAAELHVTPAAVLRHVPSKQALFAAAMRARHIELPAAIVHLQATGGAEDPRVVLRRLAEEFVPFVSKTIAENLAIYMHRRSQTSIVLPFDVRDDDSPPRRGLRIVADYFHRAAEAGVLHVEDPRAASLHGIAAVVRPSPPGLQRRREAVSARRLHRRPHRALDQRSHRRYPCPK